MNSIKWPYLGAANEPINPTKEAINKIMVAAEYLFLVSQAHLHQEQKNNEFYNESEIFTVEIAGREK